MILMLSPASYCSSGSVVLWESKEWGAGGHVLLRIKPKALSMLVIFQLLLYSYFCYVFIKDKDTSKYIFVISVAGNPK